MAQANSNKIKLLKLMEMLRQETDEAHPLRRTEICERLAKDGIGCDIRTLSKDIAVLNDYGFEVMIRKEDHENFYYVEDRSFSVPELKILIDAVQAASFITEKKTADLIEKIAELGGSNRAAILKDNIVHFNTRKHGNEAIYYNVDTIETAIQQDKKIIFRYFDIDENGDRMYRRDGHHYVVEPVALVFNDDNYYLVSYSSKHENTANYRLDRMDSVETVDEDITDKAKELRESMAGYTESVFKMYGGELQDVTLQFDQKLIGAVYDKFGEGTRMLRINDTTCVAAVKAQISPTFWGWLFQFGGQMKINSPEELKEEYKKQAQQLLCI